MAFNFFRRQLNERERAVADRLPPGQYLTEKWPVLHYGGVPRIDLATWDFSVRGLVEAHGGAIEVGEADGCGAAFRFTLPRARAEG